MFDVLVPEKNDSFYTESFKVPLEEKRAGVEAEAEGEEEETEERARELNEPDGDDGVNCDVLLKFDRGVTGDAEEGVVLVIDFRKRLVSACS